MASDLLSIKYNLKDEQIDDDRRKKDVLRKHPEIIEECKLAVLNHNDLSKNLLHLSIELANSAYNITDMNLFEGDEFIRIPHFDKESLFSEEELELELEDVEILENESLKHEKKKEEDKNKKKKIIQIT